MFASKKIIRTLLLASSVTAMFASQSSWAQAAYPNKALKFIVPFSAGSATDTVGRILALAMSEQLGQTVVVENKAGANGIPGAEAVKAAHGDPYTLLVTTSTTQAANLSLYKKIPYDPVKDFTPIGKIGETGFILMVRDDHPAKSMKEFVDYAKSHPQSYGHGSSGSWVSGALLSESAKLHALGVPYRSIPPALTDLLGGQIQFAFADVGNAVAQMNGGKMRGLGVTTAKRAGKAPNVPPIADTVKDYEVSAWFAIMAPSGIPPEAAKRLESALQKALTKPEVREKLNNAGLDIDAQNSATLARTIEREIKKWGTWVKVAGIQPE